MAISPEIIRAQDTCDNQLIDYLEQLANLDLTIHGQKLRDGLKVTVNLGAHPIFAVAHWDLYGVRRVFEPLVQRFRDAGWSVEIDPLLYGQLTFSLPKPSSNPT